MKRQDIIVWERGRNFGTKKLFYFVVDFISYIFYTMANNFQ